MKNPVLRLIVPLVVATVLLSAAAPGALASWPDCPWDPTDPGVCGEEPKVDMSHITRVTIDGKPCEVSAILSYHARTYLPVRAFSTCLGLTVDWFKEKGPLDGTAVINGVVGVGRPFTAYFQPQSEDHRVKVMEGVKQTYFFLDAQPFIWQGMTMVPFRFVTDLANVKVDWIEGNESRPNEVKVDTTERAVPLDQWDVAAQYVGYTQGSGFALSEEPPSGWAIYPSTLRHVRSALELYNGVLKEQHPALEWDSFRLRVQGEYGPIDYRGPVSIVWFKDEEQAILYMHNLQAKQKIIKAGTGVITGALSLWFGKVTTAVTTLSTFAGLNVSAWAIWAEDWTDNVQTCASLAALDKYKSQRPEGAPAIWGMAETPTGERCLPFYTDNPWANMKKI